MGNTSKPKKSSDSAPASPTSDDPGRLAWESQSPVWSAVSLQEASLPRRNIEFIVAKVLQSAARVASSPLDGQFRAMPTFDSAHLDALAPTAEALRYVRVQYLRAEAAFSEAQLPLKVVAEAKVIRERMWKCADYHLGDRPEVRAELDDIQKVYGSVYLDLATDLERLATLYAADAYRAELQSDKRHYRASDVDDARKASREIVTTLGTGTGELAKWTREIARAWQALTVHWAEVAAAGRFLERHDDPDTRWPALNAIVRERATTPATPATPDVEKPAPV